MAVELLAVALEPVVSVFTGGGEGLEAGVSAVLPFLAAAEPEAELEDPEKRLGSRLGSAGAFDGIDDTEANFAAFCAATAASATLRIFSIDGCCII